jgi:hypothetical protein
VPEGSNTRGAVAQARAIETKNNSKNKNKNKLNEIKRQHSWGTSWGTKDLWTNASCTVAFKLQK